MKSIAATTHSVRLNEFQGCVVADVRMKDRPHLFCIDIYSYLRREHPDHHLGWWSFLLPPGEHKIKFHFDLRSFDNDSVKMIIDGKKSGCIESWTNPSYLFDPLQELMLVLRDGDRNIEQIEYLVMKIDDPAVLKQFYARLHENDGYASSLPFLPTMHLYKLEVLKRLFKEYIPAGGKVIDVGCGRCLFTDIQPEWPFKIFSGDLDPGLISQRKKEVPQNEWYVSDATHIPFASDTFDALFAGEIIEHVPDPVKVLHEWKRVLRKGGILILTTPNRNRLLAMADGRERPYSPDHLKELSFNDLSREVLPRAGFRVLESTGIYLELLLNWFSRNPRQDYLQTDWNREKFVPFMKFLNRLGRLIPQYSLDLIFVCESR